MVWQDWVIGIVNIGLSYALVPQVMDGFKLKKSSINIQTGLITFSGLFVLSFLFFTLGLYFSTLITFLTGVLWLILLIQTVMYGKSSKLNENKTPFPIRQNKPMPKQPQRLNKSIPQKPSMLPSKKF